MLVPLRWRSRHHGFTLIELLVVAALLALLSALLLPALGTSRAMGRRSACSSQLRQLGMAMAMYQQDWSELPQHLSAIYPSYLTDPRLLVCPSDPLRGQHDGNNYLEGNLYLSGGVSYQYYPQWETGTALGWYRPAPDFGGGKWDDLTPLAGCVWHWARTFNKTQSANLPNSRGWQLVLALGGAVRRLRVEDPVTDFEPAKYH